MKVLGRYEHVSGQLINSSKSIYYMHDIVVGIFLQIAGEITGFNKGNSHSFILVVLSYMKAERKRIIIV